MARVTLEGSLTPSTFLARGARVTVERTSYVDKLIRKGYVIVVWSAPEVVPVVEPAAVAVVETEPTVDDLDEIPSVTALKSQWSAFLDSKSIYYLESATKSDMIAAWQEHLASHGE